MGRLIDPYRFGTLVTTLISGGTGTNIGTMTENGGLAAGFDGTTSQAQAACAYDTGAANGVAYIGKQYASAKEITKWECWPSNDTGYNNNANQTLALRYSDNGSAWTEGDSVTVQGTAGAPSVSRTVSGLGSHVYWSIFFKAGPVADARLAEAQFYEDI